MLSLHIDGGMWERLWLRR